MSQLIIANGFAFVSGHAPARACVRALLMLPGLDVEIAVVAAL